jgi:tRNA pseudouridine32 synthase/23S rRNA pseudouridine746 synthase
MLHAAILEFPHPAGGSRRIEAPPPDDFLGLAKALGLPWNAKADAIIP